MNESDNSKAWRPRRFFLLIFIPSTPAHNDAHRFRAPIYAERYPLQLLAGESIIFFSFFIIFIKLFVSFISATLHWSSSAVVKSEV